MPYGLDIRQHAQVEGRKLCSRVEIIERGACDQEDHGHDAKPENRKRFLLLAKRTALHRPSRRWRFAAAVFGEAGTLSNDEFLACLFQRFKKIEIGGRGRAQRNGIEPGLPLRLRSEIIPDGVGVCAELIGV